MAESIQRWRARRSASVNLASQATKTATCVIGWSGHRATVVEVKLGVNDDLICELIASVNKLGIDVHLGWPLAFTEAVAVYTADGSWPREYSHATNDNFRLRRTDIWVRDDLGRPSPLSVSADRISIPAMRVAALLSRLPKRIDRDGSGVVVEVYPAAALRRWGIDPRKYKRKENPENRSKLIDELLGNTPWLDIRSGDRDLCVESDDAFNALVAGLVARACVIDLVDVIPPGERESALREGWIAVPIVGSLSRLAEGESEF